MLLKRLKFLPASALLGLLLLGPSAAHAESPIQRQKDGVQLKLKEGFLRLRFLSDSMLRVSFSKGRGVPEGKIPPLFPRSQSYQGWQLKEGGHSAFLSTLKFKVELDKASGRLAFFNDKGESILSEAGRSLEAASVEGEKAFHVRQQWAANEGEALYGLGQNQLGLLDLKGHDLELWQRNTAAVVPYLVSSRGYGIFWDNASYTRFGDLGNFEAIPGDCLLDPDGKAGGLQMASWNGSAALAKTAVLEAAFDRKTGILKHPDFSDSPNMRNPYWEGFIQAPLSGDYQFDCYSNGGILVRIDGQAVMEHWRQGWLTEHDRAKLRLEAGKRYSIRIEWNTEQGSTFRFTWKKPSGDKATSLWSEMGDAVDYTFVYGPEMDKVVAGYRQLTGKAPLMPNWAFGLWQSRQRYETAQQSLEVVDGFRKRGIPFDNIVQDWQYWKKDSWGSHQFDKERFPDPDAWLKALHEKNAHVMISVWGKFYPGNPNFDEMQKQGYLYQPILDEGIKDWIGFPYTFYDPLIPAARKLFWAQLDRGLFKKGIDAWWMDATEPDIMPSPPTLEGLRSHMKSKAFGSGARMLNAYPLMNSKGIYQGQRASAPDQRVFILTRCAFAGSQAYASAIWSGDITSTWTSLQKQIPAGLGMSLSGIPYWTTDIGGYTMPHKFFSKDVKKGDEEEWRELNTRWFQYATFCPLLRSHGEQRHREMWEFGGEKSEAYKAMLKFDRLRYRLFPYLYSTAWGVTSRDETFMRPLVMGWPGDEKARQVADEYLFGPAFLVAPVTQHKARSREVYLPEAHWYDFWSGEAVQAGLVKAPAPFDSMPLYVRAGSIVPLGPELQYVAEKAQDPITLYVYAGADGEFVLHEDDGLSYGYERGQYADIGIQWKDAQKQLSLGARKGSYPGMLQKRTFNVVLVSKEHPAGYSSEPRSPLSVSYEGTAQSIELSQAGRQ